MSDVKTDISELKNKVRELENRIKSLETKASGGDDSARRPAPPVKFERNSPKV